MDFHNSRPLIPRSGYYSVSGTDIRVIQTVHNCRLVCAVNVTHDEFCARECTSRILLQLDVQEGELQVRRAVAVLLERNAIGLIFTEVMFVPH